MAPQSLLVCLATLVAGTIAQSFPDSTVWSSFAFVMHGERTPLEGNLSIALTPLGAQQMFAQGAAFRQRYLQDPAGANQTENRITTRESIHGISRTAIDNNQLDIIASKDSFIATGALAFIQGLYPPIPLAFSPGVGGNTVSYSTDTKNFTEYPLGGYQYPAIDAVSLLDEQSVYLQGQASCPSWIQSAIFDFQKDPYAVAVNGTSYAVYQDYFSSAPLKGKIPLSHANYFNAYRAFDYLSYMRNHDKAVFEGLEKKVQAEKPEETEDLFEFWAAEQQYSMNADKKASGRVKGDMIRTIAGRTLARKIINSLQGNYEYGGELNKMTLIFGSLEPFLAFFALSGLRDHEGDLNSPWRSLPSPGAAMIFELIGEPAKDGRYPSIDDLKVRFLYRKDANPETPFLEYGIFGSSNAAHRMPFRSFKTAMASIAIDIADWCTMCNSPQLFCAARQGLSSGRGSSGRGSTTSAPVAGVIGAVITVALVGLGVLAAFIFGGIRVHRVERSQLNRGFKGEKMASDTDLVIAKGGGHHSRVGSWELRDGKPVDAAETVPPKDFGLSVDKDIDDDRNSVIGAPVKPRESV